MTVKFLLAYCAIDENFSEKKKKSVAKKQKLSIIYLFIYLVVIYVLYLLLCSMTDHGEGLYQ